MSQDFTAALLVGSLRADSLNRKVAERFAHHAAFKTRFVDVDVPHYNEDREADVPAEWARLREEMGAADAMIFFTPEYNRSMPSTLKNVIDVCSRPWGKACITGKPAVVISGSQGPTGGFGANHAMRQALVYLDNPVMQQPEAYLGMLGKKFGPDAGPDGIDKDLDALLAKLAEASNKWLSHMVERPR